MRFSLIVPQMLLSALGVGAMVGALSGSVRLAVLSGLAASVMVGLSTVVVLGPLVNRIGALARSVTRASERERIASGSATLKERALGPGEDELELADHAFTDLARRWEERAMALTAESSTLSAVLDGMVEGIWVTDPEGGIVRHNLALTELLRPPGPIVGETPLGLIRSQELNDAVLAACRQMVSSRLEVAVEGETPRTLAVQVMPLRWGHKGSAAVFHDITELRRLENVRKDFVANVSHELRTPIAAILGYSETLKSGAIDDRAHAPRMVEIIHRQSERLSALVNDLLELSRLESGAVKLERATVSVDAVGARAADAVQPRALEKQISVQLQLDPDLYVVADAQALEQVLVNLLDNAAKYTPRLGTVRLSGTRVDGRVALFVRDNGVGIEERHLGRIFERFYRVDKGRSRETGGTGLGLSIVKHLVTTMGGEVRVQSKPGTGSEFTVLLPEGRPPAPLAPYA